MHISVEDLNVDIIESDPENEDEFGGRWGWFWHESHRKPCGPFGTAPEAVADFSAWFARRYTPAAMEAVGTAGDDLPNLFLANAAGFLTSAVAHRDNPTLAELVLSSSCYALELTLKAYLLSRGKTDEWNRELIGHDLSKARAEAAFLGLPSDDARIERFTKAVSSAYARHELSGLCRDRPNLLAEIDYLIAIRTLHKEVAMPLEDERYSEAPVTPVEGVRDTLAQDSRISQT